MTKEKTHITQSRANKTSFPLEYSFSYSAAQRHKNEIQPFPFDVRTTIFEPKWDTNSFFFYFFWKNL